MKSSRWDALKPDNTDNNREQHSSKSRTTTTRRRKQHQLLVPTIIANNNQQHNGDNNNNFFFSSAHQPRRSTRHNNNNSNHLDSSSLQHPTHHHYFETLIERCCLQRRKESTDWNKSVKNLALLVGQYSNELSSQQVCRAVRDVFLPYLSVDDDNDMETGKVAILNSIRDLLQQQQQPTPTRNSKHMIALLAPSVDDISQAGREVQVRNPIRLALFATLVQHCLSVVVVIMENKNQETIRCCNNLSSSLQLQQQQQACIKCLTTALTAATRVEGTKYHANHNARDIEPVLIRRIVVAAALGDNKDKITLSSSSSSSNSRSKRRLALELLLAYLQRHPDASSSFVSDLLLPQLPSTRTAEQQQQRLSNNNSNMSVTCPVCQRMSCASPVFLQMMHSCALWQQSPGVVQLQVVVDHQEQVQNAALVMKSLVVLLQNLPWSLWLGCGIIDDDNDNNNKTALSTRIDSSRSIIRMQSSTLTFRHRLVEALHNVIGMTNCYFRQQQQQQQAAARNTLLSTELNGPLLALLRTLLTKLPSKQLPEMQDSFFQLFTSMATAAVGNVENNKRHHSVLSEGCRDAFIEAFGGRMTPAGCTTKMCWAFKRWLQQSTDGFAFVERLIDNVSSSKECHSLVLALVRSYPGAVLEREMVWASFRSTIQRMMTLSSSSSSSSNDYSKLKGYLLIEGLLHGRREGEYNSSDLKAVDLFFPGLKSNWLEKSNSMTCRISSCNSFGSLLPSDWKHVIKVDGGAKGIVKSLLSVCTDCERTSGKLRAAGCKAIGDISTSLLSVQEFIDNPDAALLLSEILETMNFAVNDSNSTTRCMALYAIGNVSSSLNGTILQKPIDSKVMSKTARQCLAKLSEELDEKVAGNAIRSIGHIARLALECNHTPSFERGGIEVSKFLSQIVFALKDRIVAVLDLTMKAMKNSSSSSSSTKLSWKRRSAIKKHGWGACNALAGLFENGYCEPTACCPVVECLVHCLQHALEINEKVALAAMRALRSLHPDVLPNVLHNELLSDAVTSCIAVMAEKEEGGCTLSSRLDADFKLTLGHLLQCIVSGQNASKVLCKMSSEQALFLLEWMDKHDSPVETYAAFSLALQTLDVRLDVSVERTLSSKALRRFGVSGEEEFDEL